jgi:hypothetical protein
MATSPSPVAAGGRRASLITSAAVLALAGVAVSGCGGLTPQRGSGPSSPPASRVSSSPSSSPSAPPSAAPSVVQQFTSVRRYSGVADPVRLRIPEAGVDARVDRVGLTEQGWIAPPMRWEVAGWYAQGPSPGQNGPAVIVGHVDSLSGPAVFHALPRLRLGAAVHVDRADGTSETFRVVARRQVPKDRFPSEEVYSPTLRASLILMTCGGVFDAATGHYRDNVLVTAVPS